MFLYICILGTAQSMSLFLLFIAPLGCQITISEPCVINKPLTPQKSKYNVNDNGISYRYNLKRNFSLKNIVSRR